MKLRELQTKALDAMRPATASAVLELRAAPGGPKLSASDVDTLLAKAVARERVSLVLEVLAYEQGRRDAKGNVQKNRNGVRVRDGAMQSLARSGKGTPFLRDHRQGDSTARGGTVLDSRLERVTDDGHAQILQTVELTEPAAVERALRGLMSSVSIGLEANGPVTCTACGTEILTACYHFPFDIVTLKDGSKVEVEWEFSDAGLRETSEVPVPAVPTAGIQSIREQLAAQLSAAPIPGDVIPHNVPGEDTDMKIHAQLIALLGLAATASEDEVLAAVEKVQTASKADKAELAIKTTELSAFQKDIDALKADKAKRDEDTFIAGALGSGRIAKGDEEQWRALFGADAKRAGELMAKREPNTATPVGAPRQSDTLAAAAAPVIVTPSPRIEVVREPLAGRGLAALQGKLAADPRAMMFAHKFGLRSGEGLVPTTLGATAIVNAADHAAAKVGFHAAFLQELEQGDDPLGMIYTTVPSSRTVEEWNFMGDLPGFEEWTSDRKLGDLKAYKLRVENKKWSNGLRVKADDFKDDALGLLPAQVSGLAAKARRHRWDLMVKLLLNGFDGTAYPEVGDGLSYDGAFFFSDSHAGSNDNKMGAALDASGLSAAELLLASMKTLDGSDPLDVYGTHLIVGPKLRTTAEKLLQQERLANGEDNINRGKYKLIVSNRINGSYDDYWFLADLSHGIKPLIFQMREEISTTETGPNGLPAFTADELWFGAQARYNVGYFEPRLIVGSAV